MREAYRAFALVRRSRRAEPTDTREEIGAFTKGSYARCLMGRSQLARPRFPWLESWLVTLPSKRLAAGSSPAGGTQLALTCMFGSVGAQRAAWLTYQTRLGKAPSRSHLA